MHPPCQWKIRKVGRHWGGEQMRGGDIRAVCLTDGYCSVTSMLKRDENLCYQSDSEGWTVSSRRRISVQQTRAVTFRSRTKGAHRMKSWKLLQRITSQNRAWKKKCTNAPRHALGWRHWLLPIVLVTSWSKQCPPGQCLLFSNCTQISSWSTLFLMPLCIIVSECAHRACVRTRETVEPCSCCIVSASEETYQTQCIFSREEVMPPTNVLWRGTKKSKHKKGHQNCTFGRKTSVFTLCCTSCGIFNKEDGFPWMICLTNDRGGGLGGWRKGIINYFSELLHGRDNKAAWSPWIWHICSENNTIISKGERSGEKMRTVGLKCQWSIPVLNSRNRTAQTFGNVTLYKSMLN